MKEASKIITVLAAVFIVGLFSGCEDSGRRIPQDFDRSGKQMLITVIFYDNITQLNREYERRFNGVSVERDGFAVWHNPGTEPYVCEIHTLRPKYDGDVAMETMGHELAHCVFGNIDGTATEQ